MCENCTHCNLFTTYNIRIKKFFIFMCDGCTKISDSESLPNLLSLFVFHMDQITLPSNLIICHRYSFDKKNRYQYLLIFQIFSKKTQHSIIATRFHCSCFQIYVLYTFDILMEQQLKSSIFGDQYC